MSGSLSLFHYTRYEVISGILHTSPDTLAIPCLSPRALSLRNGTGEASGAGKYSTPTRHQTPISPREVQYLESEATVRAEVRVQNDQMEATKGGWVREEGDGVHTARDWHCRHRAKKSSLSALLWSAMVNNDLSPGERESKRVRL